MNENMNENMKYFEGIARLYALSEWLIKSFDVNIKDVAKEIEFQGNGDKSCFVFDNCNYLVLHQNELHKLLKKEFLRNITKFQDCVLDNSELYQNYPPKIQDELKCILENASSAICALILTCLNINIDDLFHGLIEQYDYLILVENILECDSVDYNVEEDYYLIKIRKDYDFFLS